MEPTLMQFAAALALGMLAQECVLLALLGVRG